MVLRKKYKIPMYNHLASFPELFIDNKSVNFYNYVGIVRVLLIWEIFFKNRPETIYKKVKISGLIVYPAGTVTAYSIFGARYHGRANKKRNH